MIVGAVAIYTYSYMHAAFFKKVQMKITNCNTICKNFDEWYP